MNKQEKDSMKIEVGFPECISIDLVQSTDLKHYEIFYLLFTAFLAPSAGFWVSFATSDNNKLLLTISIVFTIMTFVFGLFAYKYRSNTFKSSIKKTIYLNQ